MTVERIGVIGGGIGGLGAAWLLDQQYQVTLLERNDYIGGHTHTLDVGAVPVDTGFMVFNRRTYPLLCAMFAHLGVESYPTDMSFAASLDGGRLEYAGTNLNTLFGQRRNLLDWRFLRMLIEIGRFNSAAKAFVSNPDADLSLGDFLTREGYSERFANHYLLPMAGAIWSCPTGKMRAFPFLSFARFFANHGLLDLVDRPVWETVRGGSRSYVERILAQFRGVHRTNAQVTRVSRVEQGVEVAIVGGERLHFDAVVMGCHADETLALIDTPSETERELLGSFPYRANQVFLHSDPALMPKRRRIWSSWNYLQQPGDDSSRPVMLTYWMNQLQDLPPGREVFVSLNPPHPPSPEHLIAELSYDHPMFDAAAIAAQQRLGEIQGRDRIWFSGAWMGHGFHEDGLRAAVEVAHGLGVEPPWSNTDADMPVRPMADPTPATLAGRVAS